MTGIDGLLELSSPAVRSVFLAAAAAVREAIARPALPAILDEQAALRRAAVGAT